MKVTRAYKCSKIIRAPLGFVYDWCTDFRNDDPAMTGSKSSRRILEKSKERVVYSVDYKDQRKKGHVSVVTLKPPSAWHLDTAGNEKDTEVADYRLTKIGEEVTRLDILFRETFAAMRAPTRGQLSDHVSELWDKYIVYLEREYTMKRTQRGGSPAV